MKSAISLVLISFSFSPAARALDEISFSREIQPIFSEKCFGCHGPDKMEGGLRLDQANSATKKLESGEFAIVAKHVAKSSLFARISSSDDSERMPPEGEPLSRSQIRKIEKWIEQGATFDTHWAYIPVANPAVPGTIMPGWTRNEIDRFVADRLQEKKIRPSGIADRATLIKRVYYDLIGLPPTPADVDRFLENKTPNAYGQLVDRLLASKHFGERWGRHWLDKARYADSDGYEKDRPRLNAWRYRDWVINAFNDDLPFDQFTIEQLAGDLLPSATALQKLATAFHRQTLTNTEGGTDQEQFRVEATFDRTETTAAIWMGLTLTCARCHTHKYDQISQDEYYQLFSFFNDSNETNASVPVGRDANNKYETELKNHQRELAKLDARLAEAKKKISGDINKWLQDQKKKLAAEKKIQVHPVKIYRVKSSSGAKLSQDKEGAYLVSGEMADKDKYTLYIESPASGLTGIRLDVLTDSSLPKNGPGRAPNGNFVLSQIRAYTSDDPDFKKYERIEFVGAEADFSQGKFSPAGALSDQAKSGWAIAPQMGKPHQITFFTRSPVEFKQGKYLQVVLDQPYGGQHTLGKFRVQTITGFDPTKSLPANVVQAIGSKKLTQDQFGVVSEFVAQSHPLSQPIWKEREQLKKKRPSLANMSVRVMAPAKRKTRLLHRGDFLQPKGEVTSNVLKVVSRNHPLVPAGRQNDVPQNKSTQMDRLDLAKWLVDPGHPLTARVTVNQVWAQLFGKGIVSTQNDFGVRGDLPTHPGLLDWLAWEFSRDMGWSQKKLIKKIVMSATYQQASVHREDLKRVDPTNQLLARQNRVRVPAEIIRDLYLAASGLLSPKIGGPSVFPPLPAGVTDLSYANNFKWKTSVGENRYRRGMYTFFKRTSPHPNLISFDCPDSNTTQLDRNKSNTPIQALVTLNNEVYVESAQALAKRVLNSGLNSVGQRIRLAMRSCLGRDPGKNEIQRFEKLFQLNLEFYRGNAVLAKSLLTRHAVVQIPVIENAAWVATTRMIMNLDEFIVRE